MASAKPLYQDNLRAYIIRRSRALGLDPRATIAVATVEGGFAGAVGDVGLGGSYGPFQLFTHGALPAWVAAKGKAFARRWANSPTGVDYALGRMVGIGAAHKTSYAAVNAIVRLFERPAQPTAEVGRAMGVYATLGELKQGTINLGQGDPYTWAESLAKAFGLTVTSTKRPAGTLTASGNVSDHTVLGRAADLSGSPAAMKKLWRFLLKHRAGIKQAIYGSQQIKDGKLLPYTAGDHPTSGPGAHIHLALAGTPVDYSGGYNATMAGIGDKLAGVGGGIMAVPNFLGKLADVHTWLRVGYGVGALVCLSAGGLLLARELGAPAPTVRSAVRIAGGKLTKGTT